MSTRDARLSPQERAALAGLEAAAAADDPQFAARLRGSRLARFARVVRALEIPAGLARRLRYLRLRRLSRPNGWWGISMTLSGLALMIVGLTAGLWLGVSGALVASLGLALVARVLADALDRRQLDRTPSAA